MKYIRKFESEEEYKSLSESGKLIPPMIGMIKDENGNNSLKLKSIPPKYLNFKALEDGCTISMSSATNPNIEYSTDYCETWTTWDYSEISLNKGDIVWMRGWNPEGFSNSSSKNKFVITAGKIGASGNILSLVWGKRFEKNNTIPSSLCFGDLFRSCTSLTTAPELPATTLADYCYQNMFNGCTSLTTAPKLPATTLALGCYQSMFQDCTSLTTVPELPTATLAFNCYDGMFQGCTSLTTAPELPATNLAAYCYRSMFQGCTSLTTAPELPATTLASSCYYDMFYGCTSLTIAPELPATILAYSCYSSMFYGCTSLTTAPELPATTLAEYCYSNMFYGCASLTTAPQLPATTLASQCYYNMFRDCTSLTIAPSILPATTLAIYCYRSMFYGCSSLVTAPELPATTLASNCYYYMFYGCSSLVTAPELPATTLASQCYYNIFRDCTNLNNITMLATDISASSCLYNWVSGVASTGTFIKHSDMTSLPTGASGIPSGWEVKNLISFKVINTEYWAEEGMTWEEFLNSKYNNTKSAFGLQQIGTSDRYAITYLGRFEYLGDPFDYTSRLVSTSIIIKDHNYEYYSDGSGD